MTNRLLITIIVGGLGLLLIGCYPLTLNRPKWAIKWDKELEAGKDAFMQAPAARQRAERPPNIVLIVADDLGKYEVSAYGVDHISTPHIDQIGAEGVVF